jgi:hypothetical protein
MCYPALPGATGGCSRFPEPAVGTQLRDPAVPVVHRPDPPVSGDGKVADPSELLRALAGAAKHPLQAAGRRIKGNQTLSKTVRHDEGAVYEGQLVRAEDQRIIDTLSARHEHRVPASRQNIAWRIPPQVFTWVLAGREAQEDGQGQEELS